jgi:hypothetical protein
MQANNIPDMAEDVDLGGRYSLHRFSIVRIALYATTSFGRYRRAVMIHKNDDRVDTSRNIGRNLRRRVVHELAALVVTGGDNRCLHAYGMQMRIPILKRGERTGGLAFGQEAAALASWNNQASHKHESIYMQMQVLTS